MPVLTMEQIKNFALDSRSVSNARKIAKAEKWRRLGRDGEALWGVAIGSAGDTYAVYVMLADDASTALRCSCPSRKRPCKHVLALAIMDVNGEKIDAAPLFEGHCYA